MIALYILGGLLGLVILLLLIAVIRTLCIPQKTSDYKAPEAGERAEAYAETLAEMVRAETVSYSGVHETEKFYKFQELLRKLFPLVHERLEKTEIDGNLLYLWEGKKHDKPVVLMSHQDVVPAEGEWVHGPFSGDIADGKVWGRGASDTKCSVMGFFQAVEELLAEGFEPEEDIWLSSSCTEEWAGDGCPKLVEEMKRRGLKPWLVLDEGGGIISEPVGGIPGNFAMVGVFEKGKSDVRFTAKSSGGHASAPPKNSPIARLSAFVQEIEKKDPFKKKMLPEVQSMFAEMGKYASFGFRLILENLWLFKPLLVALLPKISYQAGAMLKTTIAFTMQSGSDAFNVLPEKATLGANMRFIPHQGMEESLAIVRGIAEKHGLTMEVCQASDYTPSADIKGDAFRFVRERIEETFPGLPVSPYVMTGATDSRFYQEICPNVLRFAPVIYGPEQMKGMHGLNENIEYNCLPGCVDFYKNVIRKAE